MPRATRRNRSSLLAHTGLLVVAGMLAAPDVLAGSGKHLVPIGFFSREGVKTPADAWRVVRRTQGEVQSALTPERLREARLPLDLMIEALAWMRRRTELATSDPAARQRLKQTLRAAISSAHDLHAEAHSWRGRDWTIKQAQERYAVLARTLSGVPAFFPPGQLEAVR